MNERWLNLAAQVARTSLEGPGERFALWVQGCPLRCPGCCNPDFLADRPATRMAVGELAASLAEEHRRRPLEGVTLLGGEPFAQAEPLAAFARHARRLGLGVMTFTGFTLEALRRHDRADWRALLDATDLLVDGPYVEARRTTERRWIGSTNQVAHALTPRYRSLVEGGVGDANGVELRWSGGRLEVHGFPVAGFAMAGAVDRARTPTRVDAVPPG